MRALCLALALAIAAQGAPAHAQHDAHGSQHRGHGAQHDTNDLDPPDGHDTHQAGEHDDHAAHAPAAPAGNIDAIGNALSPPVPSDHAADRLFPPEKMASARAALAGESRFNTTSLRIDRLEYRGKGGRNGYAWEGEVMHGGDIDRLVIASEGEGARGKGPETAEVRALWRHALDPWWNLEIGARHDFRPDPERSYGVIGIEGLAPYWFEVEGQLLVSNKGDVHLRAKGGFDQRITQRLILEPEIEVEAALQDVPELGIASGISGVELGARLRYEVTRRFAPYVGVHWERQLGGTADLARAAGEGASELSTVIGIRAWF